MQEAIISEEQWLRVQELRQHRRRLTATDRRSPFLGNSLLSRLWSKTAFLRCKEPETQSGILEMLQI